MQLNNPQPPPASSGGAHPNFVRRQDKLAALRNDYHYGKYLRSFHMADLQAIQWFLHKHGHLSTPDFRAKAAYAFVDGARPPHATAIAEILLTLA